MRFDRPETQRFVVICPSCKHLFDAGTAQFEKDLIPATLVGMVNANDPSRLGSNSKSRTQPAPANASVADASRESKLQLPAGEQLNFEEFLPPLSLTPSQPINRGPIAATQVGRVKLGPAHQKISWHKRSGPIIAVIAILIVVGASAMALIFSSDLRASLGIGRFRELALVDRYAMALKDCQENLANPRESIENPEALLLNKLASLEELLVDCVRMKTVSESRHVEVRAEMQKLFDSQMALKESAYQIVPNLKEEQRLQFAKLTALISLVELRLSFGLREVPIGSNEVDAYSRKGIVLLRELDRSLLAANEEGFELHLDEIARILDQLDELAIQRIETGELRGKMPFDYRLMAKASEGWHQWCLSHSGSETASQVVRRAIDQERANTWDRYHSALTANSLSPREVAAVDRIREQIRNLSPQIATSGILAAGDTASTKQSTVANSSDFTAGANSFQNHSSQELASATAGRADSADFMMNSFLSGPKPESNSKRTRRSGDISDVAAIDAPAKFGLPKDEASIAPSRGQDSSVADSGQKIEHGESRDSAAQSDSTSATKANGLNFPTPHIVGPNSLCLKVQSSDPDRIKLQASELGNRLKVLPHIQENGNLITITYSPFSGSLNEAVELVEFGTIEIIDGQTRTLFVVDH